MPVTMKKLRQNAGPTLHDTTEEGRGIGRKPSAEELPEHSLLWQKPNSQSASSATGVNAIICLPSVNPGYFCETDTQIAEPYSIR